MKSKLVLTLLFVTIFLSPGCYTVLLVDDTTENASVEPAPTTQPIVEYIPVYYFLHQVPEPLPQPLQYLPPAIHVSDSPSSTSTGSEERRLIQTGRGSPDSNPAPARNDNNNNGTRNSGVRRGGR
ncbi:MAG: hypothetical protein ABSD46_01300 [Bacteroidota bacterium]